jgi:hypothetical protein
MLSFPRETVEYLPVTATLDGTETSTFQVAVVPYGERPATWTPAPYLVQNMTPGIYDVYTKVVDTPEAPVVGPDQEPSLRFRIT